MSLINDALKRTQQTTQSQVPPRIDELELSPIDPHVEPARKSGGVGKALLWFTVLLVLVANAALWFVFKHRSPDAQVEARVADEEVVEQVAAPEAPKPASEVIAEPVTSVIPAEPVAAEPETDPPTPLEVEAPPLPVRPQLKLQTIVSHPTRPSAMINNRIVFVGDRVEDCTITHINTTEVTLAFGDDTFALSLP